MKWAIRCFVVCSFHRQFHKENLQESRDQSYLINVSRTIGVVTTSADSSWHLQAGLVL